MPACRLSSSNSDLNGKLVKAPLTGDDTRCDIFIDSQSGAENGIVAAIFEPTLDTEVTIANLLPSDEDESRLIRNPDFPGLVMDPATGTLFVPGTQTEIGGPPRAATIQEIEAARAEGRGAAAGTTGDQFEEDVKAVVELTGVSEDRARQLVFAASKFAPPAGGAGAASPTMQLNALADAIQAGSPGTTREEAMQTALVSLGFVAGPGERGISVSVLQPDGTDISLTVSDEAALRFFQDETQLTETQRANLAAEALTLRSQQVALRGQDIAAMSNQDANLIALGRLSVAEAQLRLDRVVTAQDTLFKERAEVLKGFVPDSFIKIRPGGQEVMEFRFPQILEQLQRAGAGAFEIEQFDIGIVRIDPEQRAREVLEATPTPAVSGAAAASIAGSSAALAEMRAAGVPLPETEEAA